MELMKTKTFNEIFIHNTITDITIITISIILINNLINMSIVIVEDMIVPWMCQTIFIVAKLSRIDVFDFQSQEKE